MDNAQGKRDAVADLLDHIGQPADGVWPRDDEQIDCRLTIGIIRKARAACRHRVKDQSNGSGSFQRRVAPWMQACFGPEISSDHVERGDRLLEEIFELLQSGGYDPCRIVTLASYVWNRPPGEPAQEVGGVMVTLAAYCLAHGLDMHGAGETELARIWTKVEQIRAKQAAKAQAIGNASPLPVAPGGEQ